MGRTKEQYRRQPGKTEAGRHRKKKETTQNTEAKVRMTYREHYREHSRCTNRCAGELQKKEDCVCRTERYI